jgi:uncharacterized protein YqeY
MTYFMRMSYFEELCIRIRADLTRAMKSRSSTEVSTLRTLLGSLDNATAVEVSGGGHAKEVPGRVPDETEVKDLVTEEIRARELTVGHYLALNRPEDAKKAEAILITLRRYLN